MLTMRGPGRVTAHSWKMKVRINDRVVRGGSAAPKVVVVLVEHVLANCEALGQQFGGSWSSQRREATLITVDIKLARRAFLAHVMNASGHGALERGDRRGQRAWEERYVSWGWLRPSLEWDLTWGELAVMMLSRIHRHGVSAGHRMLGLCALIVNAVDSVGSLDGRQNHLALGHALLGVILLLLGARMGMTAVVRMVHRVSG